MVVCLLSGAAAITARRMLLTLPPLPVYTGYPPQPRLHCARLPHFLQLGGRGRAAVVRWGQQDTHTYIRHYLIYYPGHILPRKKAGIIPVSHRHMPPHCHTQIRHFNGLSGRLGSVIFIVVYLLPKLRPSVASLSGLPVCTPQPSPAPALSGELL